MELNVQLDPCAPAGDGAAEGISIDVCRDGEGKDGDLGVQ